MAVRRKRRQKNIEPTDLPIAEVVWVDAAEEGEIGWNDLDELLEKAAEPCPVMRSVGYVLHHSEEHISLISTIRKSFRKVVQMKLCRGTGKLTIRRPH